MSSKHALVVDDNAVNRILAQSQLKRLGWTADLAEDGVAALKLAAGCHYPLVLLDISMPGMNGEEVCRHLRALPWGSAMRIVAFTAHAMPEERQRFLGLGFDDILPKPVSQSMMEAAVAQAIG